MTKPHPRRRPLLFATAALSAPGVLALAVLVAADRLAPWPAVLAGLGMGLGLALLIQPHLAYLEAVAEYVRSVAAQSALPGRMPRAPRSPTPFLPALGSAAADAGRIWNARRRELEAMAAANDAILEGLPDPLILLDAERRILRANPAAEVAFGRALAGRDFIAVLRNPALIEAINDVLAGGGGRLVEFSSPVPVERVFSARVEPLDRGALIALHDVTGIKRAERMRADFVANASHELRTPLSALLGFIETLRGPARDDPEARDRFLAIMHDQAARMSRLVADLLSLSRIELNEHSPPTGRVESARLLGGVAGTLQLKAAEKEMTIALAPELDGLPPVLGDADELAQVFQNLIDNAVKYSRAGTTVRVAGRFVPARPADPRDVRTGTALRRLAVDAVAIAVADEGEGIAREHLPRLTERFYRVDSVRSRDLGGTGLGLAIVKHIVSRHRGALEIDSTLGKGSTFTVHLPAAPAADGEPGPTAAARSARRPGAPEA